MYQVIQHRYIRGSDQNNRPNVVWTGGRFKEANGQAKSNLMSHLEMVHKHEHYPYAAVTIHLNSATSTFHAEYYDDDGLAYSIRYEVKEISDGD